MRSRDILWYAIPGFLMIAILAYGASRAEHEYQEHMQQHQEAAQALERDPR